MTVLVTGADGFVGSWLVPALVAAGHQVVAAVRADVNPAERPWLRGISTIPLELKDETSVETVAEQAAGGVIHLAAVASGGDARRDPAGAWDVNARGTEHLAAALARHGRQRLVVASTAEVYGPGPEGPRVETDRTAPCSPYAESKLAAERAALAVGKGGELEVIVARSFPHTGRGQDTRFVVPAFARRLIEAKRAGKREVPVGNLTPVRDILHVSDVVAAYVRLLEDGTPGETYNVAAGREVSIRELFERLAALVGHDATPVESTQLVRSSDIRYLVGDAAKLTARTGWQPQVSLEDALAEVVDAQTD